LIDIVALDQQQRGLTASENEKDEASREETTENPMGTGDCQMGNKNV
jgi:hypothetical protein